MNISDYSYYRLYREAEARMERELEARRISLERATLREPHRLFHRMASWIGVRTARTPQRVVNRAGSTS